MLRLRVKAPFAAFRTFTAGSFRPTAPFITPSAAYGLLLNVANVESRRDDGVSPMTVTAVGLPAANIAVGAVAGPDGTPTLPEVQTLYQQLHNYPVGTSGQERAGQARGSKYNIQPIRREFLSGLDAYVCLAGSDWLEDRVRRGLADGCQFAPEGRHRYGVPFLGDNSFTLSVLREEQTALPAYWYCLVRDDTGPRLGQVSRLTVWIDRQDMSRTVTRLFSRLDQPQVEVPDSAWTEIRPPQSEV